MNARPAIVLLLLILTATDTLGAPRPRGAATRPAIPPGASVLRDLEYARPNERPLLLDLYLPADAKANAKAKTSIPLVIFVHGGGWRNGSKERVAPVLPLLERGYAVAAINYRLTDVAPFPAQIHDVQSAVRFLRSRAKEHGLDPDRFAAWGSSAGGHLVALLGVGADLAELQEDPASPPKVSARVQAVVDYFGPSDFLNWNSTGSVGGAVERLFQGPVQQKRELAKLASPVTHVTPDDPPFLILHGDADRVVPLQQSERLRDVLAKAGVEVTLKVVKGAGHGWGQMPPIDPVVEFLDRHLEKSAPVTAPREQAQLDERPEIEGEWGFRPIDQSTVELNPPRFSWRPQKQAASYVVEAARDASFREVVYRATDVEFNVHAPPRTFETGRWFWRFRAVRSDGKSSAWSSVRSFEVPASAVQFPLPPRDELLARVPTSHPRLFVRPEEMEVLRRRARSDLRPQYERLLAEAERLLHKPVDVIEPPKYPPGTVFKSEQWREYWTGGMHKTPAILTPAVTLGFAYQLSGDVRFGAEAKRILLEAAKWDPFGATGYRYNDEAGMPYNYLFARGYTFVHELLSDADRKLCRDVMRLRGRETFEHLCPGHFWTPYKSHQNRAWHFLGEMAIAFRGEIDEADDWLWFAMNVFANVYPVWNDADGGWHEGLAYWRSYLDRFTWWADAMRAAVDVDAFKLPYFSRAGDYALYLMPPGSPRGGFGDQVDRIESASVVPLMSILAAQAQNPYWQWYVEAHGDSPKPVGGYLGFIRAARYPQVTAKPPTDLPTSRVFAGIGQAALNTDLTDAHRNVQVLFKSSPMGAQSHGYDAQNAFQLIAFGQPLLISSGTRDLYGSDHHANWMWETKSTNNVTVGGQGQIKHSPKAIGLVTAFHTSDEVDFVQGDASRAYDPPLRRYVRSILFAKPDLIVIVDELEADSPQTFQYWLHAPVEMKIAGQETIGIETESAGCHIALLEPRGLQLSQTDQFDAPLRERVKLTQYHLKAEATSPAAKQRFIGVLRPYRGGAASPEMPAAERDGDRVTLRTGQTTIEIADGTLTYARGGTKHTFSSPPAAK